jgi:hypothetical protein
MRLDTSPTRDLPSALRGVRRAVRYAFVLAWTLALCVGANVVMIWIVDQLTSRA